MRRVVYFLGIAFLAWSCLETAEAQRARPQFRPAVLGSGPDSLINRIDGEGLIKQGQKDGAVMFCSIVNKTGLAVQTRTYRGMPGTELLEAELRKRLEGVKFTPAIYNYQPVDVILSGTVVFSATEKPHVRIFLNQDPNELKQMSDFIAPQPVFGADSAFVGLDYPASAPVQVNAVVDIGVNVDANGNLRDLRVIAEEPPLVGFGVTAVKDFTGAKFIPAFRSGDATESNGALAICYQPPDWETAQKPPEPLTAP